MIGLRVRIKPKSKKAKNLFRFHLRNDPFMYVTDRLDKWNLFNPTTGISLYVDPKDDPDWEIIKK